MEDDQNIYVILDQPEILSFVFYPRRDTGWSPSGALDVSLTMPDGIQLGARLYKSNQQSPTVIYFHGNGEIAADYEFIAPQYANIGLNLLVMDYRGYGTSGGTPTVKNLIGDSVPAYHGARDLLEAKGYDGPFLVMGRSLGSVPAIELAASCPKDFCGLIIESGFGSMSRLWSHLGIGGVSIKEFDTEFPNLRRIRDVKLPTLVIHGERDSLIPRLEGEALYQASPALDKSLVIIHGADHNDIMTRDITTYFNTLNEFVVRQTFR